MQNFKENEQYFQNSQRKLEQQMMEKEMEKYLALLRVERFQEKTKNDDYVQPITPMMPKQNIKVNAEQTQEKDLAKAQEVETEVKVKENKYNIIYFNPELKKAEVIETTSKIEFQSIEQKVVEETLATRNQNITMDYVFKDMIKNTVMVNPEVEKARLEVQQKPVEVEKINPVEISKALNKRDEVVVEIQKEIKEIEKAIEELQIAKNDEEIKKKVLPHLPPLTRKRIEALMRKGKADKRLLLRLLIAEDFFLIKLKFLLLSITPKEIKSFLGSLLKALKK